ncbi:hypothetical protein CTA2_4399, partial [Colletotrichum tanaceti]
PPRLPQDRPHAAIPPARRSRHRRLVRLPAARRPRRPLRHRPRLPVPARQHRRHGPRPARPPAGRGIPARDSSAPAALFFFFYYYSQGIPARRLVRRRVAGVPGGPDADREGVSRRRPGPDRRAGAAQRHGPAAEALLRVLPAPGRLWRMGGGEKEQCQQQCRQQWRQRRRRRSSAGLVDTAFRRHHRRAGEVLRHAAGDAAGPEAAGGRHLGRRERRGPAWGAAAAAASGRHRGHEVPDGAEEGLWAQRVGRAAAGGRHRVPQGRGGASLCNDEETVCDATGIVFGRGSKGCSGGRCSLDIDMAYVVIHHCC